MDKQNKYKWICKFKKDELTYYIAECDDDDSYDGFVYFVSKVIEGEEVVYRDKYKSLADFPELLNETIEEEIITQDEGNLIANKLTDVSQYLKRKKDIDMPCYLMYTAEDGIACAEIKEGKVTREMATNDFRAVLNEEEGKKRFVFYAAICEIQGASSIISKEMFEKQWNQGYVSFDDFIKKKW